ncbi:hypothetical protein X975_09981, partial [Stegodyphus mimosarum]
MLYCILSKLLLYERIIELFFQLLNSSFIIAEQIIHTNHNLLLITRAHESGRSQRSNQKVVVTCAEISE